MQSGSSQRLGNNPSPIIIPNDGSKVRLRMNSQLSETNSSIGAFYHSDAGESQYDDPLMDSGLSGRPELKDYDFDKIDITTMTMICPINGEVNSRSLTLWLRVSRIDGSDWADGKVKNGKIAHPGFPGALRSVGYRDIISGARVGTGKTFKNSVCIDVSIREKMVNCKISSFIQMVGLKDESQSGETVFYILQHIYEAQRLINKAMLNLNQTIRTFAWVIHHTLGADDTSQLPEEYVERIYPGMWEDRTYRILSLPPCSSLIKQLLHSSSKFNMGVVRTGEAYTSTKLVLASPGDIPPELRDVNIAGNLHPEPVSSYPLDIDPELADVLIEKIYDYDSHSRYVRHLLQMFDAVNYLGMNLEEYLSGNTFQAALNPVAVNSVAVNSVAVNSVAVNSVAVNSVAVNSGVDTTAPFMVAPNFIPILFNNASAPPSYPNINLAASFIPISLSASGASQGLPFQTTLHAPLSPSLSPSLPPALSHSLSPSLPPALSPSLPPALSPSLPPALSPSLPPSLSHSLSPSLPPSLSPALPPALSPALSPSLPPALPPSLSPSLPPSLPTPSGTQFFSFTPSIQSTFHPSVVPIIPGSTLGSTLGAVSSSATLASAKIPSSVHRPPPEPTLWPTYDMVQQLLNDTSSAKINGTPLLELRNFLVKNSQMTIDQQKDEVEQELERDLGIGQYISFCNLLDSALYYLSGNTSELGRTYFNNIQKIQLIGDLFTVNPPTPNNIVPTKVEPHVYFNSCWYCYKSNKLNNEGHYSTHALLEIGFDFDKATLKPLGFERAMITYNYNLGFSLRKIDLFYCLCERPEMTLKYDNASGFGVHIYMPVDVPDNLIDEISKKKKKDRSHSFIINAAGSVTQSGPHEDMNRQAYIHVRHLLNQYRNEIQRSTEIKTKSKSKKIQVQPHEMEQKAELRRQRRQDKYKYVPLEMPAWYRETISIIMSNFSGYSQWGDSDSISASTATPRSDLSIPLNPFSNNIPGNVYTNNLYANGVVDQHDQIDTQSEGHRQYLFSDSRRRHRSQSATAKVRPNQQIAVNLSQSHRGYDY